MPKLFIKTLNAITTVDDEDLLVISDGTETLKITIAQIKTKVFQDNTFTNLVSRVSSLESDVSSLQSDVSSLQTDVAGKADDDHTHP